MDIQMIFGIVAVAISTVCGAFVLVEIVTKRMQIKRDREAERNAERRARQDRDFSNSWHRLYVQTADDLKAAETRLGIKDEQLNEARAEIARMTAFMASVKVSELYEVERAARIRKAAEA